MKNTNDWISTYSLYNSNYLAHHGIKGQKWGRRRFQYDDGSLTEEGRRRYGAILKNKYRAEGFKNVIKRSPKIANLQRVNYENGKLNVGAKTRFGNLDISLSKNNSKANSTSSSSANQKVNDKSKLLKAAAIAAGTVAAGALLVKFGPQIANGVKSSAAAIRGQNFISSARANYGGDLWEAPISLLNKTTVGSNPKMYNRLGSAAEVGLGLGNFNFLDDLRKM